ncbi:MAG TPA: sigma 54-interacting transcriptional regulator, partial [Thermoanaerobaculia bacterium]|nr:sigma 54-interacting transcriptional regulator [Thermoanaerobaculia bacterium]
SRRHAVLEVPPDGGAVVSDLGSKNGTFAAGRRVRRAAVGAGGELAFGPVRARLLDADREAAGIAISGRSDSRSDLLDRPRPPSTEGVAPVERAVAALRDLALDGVAGALGDSGCGQRAVTLARAWLAGLPLAGLAFVRAGEASAEPVVVARAGVDGTVGGEPHLRVTGRAGLELHAWSADPARGGRTLARLRPCFELALHLLEPAGGGTGAETAEAAADDGPRAPETVNPRLARIYRDAARAAAGAIPILVLGESGAGKEVLARFIHDRSRRATGLFLEINCAALPMDLLEAELFGIERGVATGVEARPGLVERASGGTLFLDEVGDMPLPLQAKVLRVVEGASFYRVGGRAAIRADVRFLAATNLDLDRRVAAGTFRADLLHRLSAFRLELPPLRERPEDVPLLAAEFFHRELAARRVASPGITRAALGALVGHPWPGNVRELRNEIARAVLMLEPGEPLDLHHLSERLRCETGAAGRPLSLDGCLAEAERRAFRTALAAAGGDAAQAMDLLEIPRSTYYRKLKDLGLAGSIG